MPAFADDRVGTLGSPVSPGTRRPTMRDVAKRAGVSLKSVSRVVNKEPGVSPSLLERVRRAIDELGFHPNVGASSLRRADGKTATVGLVLEDIANPYFSAVLRAVEDLALPRGVMVFAVSHDSDPRREIALARALITRRVDGLILVPADEDQSHLAAEMKAGTAVVCVDRRCTGLDADCVVTTDETGSAEGVRHLIDVGHRRIAFLGPRGVLPTCRQRYKGYRNALETHGIKIDPELVLVDLNSTAAADGAVCALLARPSPPTALFLAQNLLTIGAIRALRRRGLENSVALVGFDDFPLADLLSPGVTVVAQDPTTSGRTAAEVLFGRLSGDTSPARVHVVPTTLVRRGSGEILPPS
jgi:LacI family transcriptional regulator